MGGPAVAEVHWALSWWVRGTEDSVWAGSLDVCYDGNWAKCQHLCWVFFPWSSLTEGKNRPGPLVLRLLVTLNYWRVSAEMVSVPEEVIPWRLGGKSILFWQAEGTVTQLALSGKPSSAFIRSICHAVGLLESTLDFKEEWRAALSFPGRREKGGC